MTLPISKYHGLGNDYLVIDAVEITGLVLPELTQRLCLPHYGLGADGLLVNNSGKDGFALRIFNPDGSEAEKSGNGLRIFARYLFDHKHVAVDQDFEVDTKGGKVGCRVSSHGTEVEVTMGKIRFAEGSASARLEKLHDELQLEGKHLDCALADTGNPHCVVPVDKALCARELARLGSAIENLPHFPERTNVQFMRLLSRQAIAIQIWERGVGVTQASGSSATAAAAVAHSLGYCDERVEVRMPGGSLAINIQPGCISLMRGPVTRIFRGDFYSEAFDWPIP